MEISNMPDTDGGFDSLSIESPVLIGPHRIPLEPYRKYDDVQQHRRQIVDRTLYTKAKQRIWALGEFKTTTGEVSVDRAGRHWGCRRGVVTL
jgi:hypothetical protein